MADFGLTEDMYATNYFCRGENVVKSEEKVPIKWMAPESIESSLYNERTDVVRVILSLYACPAEDQWTTANDAINCSIAHFTYLIVMQSGLITLCSGHLE